MNDFLPNIICVLNLRPPLAEIVAPAVGNQTVGGNQPEAAGRVVNLAVFQQECPFGIGLETHPPSVFVQNIFGTVVNRVLKHLRRRRVERRIDTSPFSDCYFHFRDSADAFIHRSYQLQIPFDTGMRHTCRHQEERAFVETRHKLLAHSPPNPQSENQGNSRYHHKLPPVGQTPPQNAFVENYQRPQNSQDNADGQRHKYKVQRKARACADRQPFGGEVENCGCQNSKRNDSLDFL